MLALFLLSYLSISFVFSLLMYSTYIDLSESDFRMLTGNIFQKTLKRIFLCQYGTWYTLRETIRPSGIFLLCVLITLMTWYTSVFAAAVILLFAIWDGIVMVFLKLFSYKNVENKNI